MAYQSLYRRYRPQRFSEVRGQEHLVRALQNAVRDDRVGHAYLFSGPRGTGKTSTARILAKVLNCTDPVDGEPCCKCESCLAIEAGTSFDVHELDAASNNKVEDIRELINKAALGTPGHTKVYILDEVHMLSTAASNALLKTLEEPPEHVTFVLATTDPQKVLPTIRSRCQHFEVHLLPAEELEELARSVIDDAGLEVPGETVDYVVRSGAGSARDMLSALDQVAAAGGVPDSGEALDELVEALTDRDTGRALVAVEQAMHEGRSPRVLGEQLIARLRDVFLASMGADLSRLADRDRDRATDQAQRLGAAGTTRALEVLGEAFVGIGDAPDPRIPLEIALVRLTRDDADLSLSALADRVARLERGAPTQAASAPSRAADSTTEARAASDAPPSEPERQSAPRGGRPADGAREALAQRRRESSSTKRTPAKREPATRAPDRPTRPAQAPEVPASPDVEASQPPQQAPAPAAATSPPTGAGPMPGRDELTLAWGDSILAALPPKAKSRFAAGRFVSVEGDVAVFGLPNEPHARRCQEVQAEVEQALTSHFSVPVALRVIVDEGAEPPGHSDAPAVQQAGAADDAAEPDEVIDVAELTDADDVAGTGVEKISQVFPGAELVEEE